MRIISGSLGGRSLKTLSGENVRPAMQKTREALFSMLEASGVVWANTPVLDLFAGSGSLAFECLSRGAPWAALVDNSHEACQLLAQNRQDLNLQEKCRIYENDVSRFLRQTPDMAYALAFIDPPYRRNQARRALDRVGAWLNAGALAIAEMEKDAEIPSSSSLEYIDTRNFGQTCLHIWKKI